MKTRFISDIHGKIPEYLQLLETCKRSVQLGDFGMGFGTRGKAEFVDGLIDQMPGDHKFIRGNHDDPAECKKTKNWIPDGTHEDGIMYIGGAFSIDWMHRTPGKSWWFDEELSWQALEDLIELYDVVRPKVMVTHTAPISIPRDHMGFAINGIGSRTEIALQEMLQVHKPEVWLYGHWHVNFDQVIEGTRFVCMQELGYIDLEV